MSVINSLSLKLIPFVSPSEERSTDVNVRSPSLDTRVSGAEVSKFYESVVSSPSLCQISKTTEKEKGSDEKQKKSAAFTRGCNLKSKSIFLYAQEGDIKRLKQCVENGISVNQQDSYGWTPIMCAACEGHFSVVQYLIENGADLNAKCKHGMTVKDIAMKTKNDAIIQLLQNDINSCSKTCSMKICKDEIEVEKFCSDCKISYKTSTIVHERSISHLLVKNKYDASTFYHIPENNKGFQMMLKSGWDKNKGLGPNADGRKFPIKTVFKKDRSCIGKNKEVAKVTHFDANNKAAIKAKKSDTVRIVKERTLKKWERKKHDAILRQREIDFRQSFNIDF